MNKTFVYFDIVPLQFIIFFNEFLMDRRFSKGSLHNVQKLFIEFISMFPTFLNITRDIVRIVTAALAQFNVSLKIWNSTRSLIVSSGN